jgi:hypothetical protein
MTGFNSSSGACIKRRKIQICFDIKSDRQTDRQTYMHCKLEAVPPFIYSHLSQVCGHVIQQSHFWSSSSSCCIQLSIQHLCWNCGVLHSCYVTKPSYSLSFNEPDSVLPLNPWKVSTQIIPLRRDVQSIYTCWPHKSPYPIHYIDI